MYPQFSDYQDRVVAFIDLQGFASEAAGIGTDEDKFHKISRILYAMKSLEDKSHKETMFQSIPGLSKSEQLSLSNGFECLAVSDSIILSYPSSPNALYYLSLECNGGSCGNGSFSSVGLYREVIVTIKTALFLEMLSDLCLWNEGDYARIKKERFNIIWRNVYEN